MKNKVDKKQLGIKISYNEHCFVEFASPNPKDFSVHVFFACEFGSSIRVSNRRNGKVYDFLLPELVVGERVNIEVVRKAHFDCSEQKVEQFLRDVAQDRENRGLCASVQKVAGERPCIALSSPESVVCGHYSHPECGGINMLLSNTDNGCLRYEVAAGNNNEYWRWEPQVLPEMQSIDLCLRPSPLKTKPCSITIVPPEGDVANGLSDSVH